MNMSDIIKRLEDAIQVCYNAEGNNDKGYPYATGYSRVVMKEMVMRLKELMNEKDRVFN
jgi:hypothetical protein